MIPTPTGKGGRARAIDMSPSSFCDLFLLVTLLLQPIGKEKIIMIVLIWYLLFE
jgi:hypothetical protein